MTFHSLCPAYCPITKDNSLCAFGQKVIKFNKIMKERGHTCFVYGPEGSEIDCTEFIPVVSQKTIEKSYGGRDWRRLGFDQNVETPAFIESNINSIKAIKARQRSENEFLLCWFGYSHLKTAQEFNDKMAVVESSVGYNSVFAPYLCFETNQHMLNMCKLIGRQPATGRDFVCYPGFETSDFLFKENKQNYALFLGRCTSEKGCQLVYDICNSIGQDVIFAGPNIMNLKDTKYAQFIGFCAPEQRKELLANAKFLFAPSNFEDPCLWSIIEAQFSGTATIGTDRGGPIDTVIQNKTGFRTNNYSEFPALINRINEINPKDCLNHALDNFALEIQSNRYEEIFKSILLS